MTCSEPHRGHLRACFVVSIVIPPSAVAFPALEKPGVGAEGPAVSRLQHDGDLREIGNGEWRFRFLPFPPNRKTATGVPTNSIRRNDRIGKNLDAGADTGSIPVAWLRAVGFGGADVWISKVYLPFRHHRSRSEGRRLRSWRRRRGSSLEKDSFIEGVLLQESIPFHLTTRPDKVAGISFPSQFGRTFP